MSTDRTRARPSRRGSWLRQKLGGRARPDLVTVVIDTDGAATLSASVASVLAQTHTDVEVLVVGVGAGPDRAGAEPDDRVRWVDAPGADRSAARDEAARQSGGAYLCFLHSAEALRPDTLARLVAALDASGADLAIEAADEAADDGADAVRLAVRLAGRAGCLFRADAWRDRQLRFGAAAGGPGADPALVALVGGARPDLVAVPRAGWVSLAEPGPIGTQPERMPDLADWIARTRHGLALMTTTARPEVTDAWLTGAVDDGLMTFVEDVERATDLDWADLRAIGQELRDAMPSERWERLPAESRVRWWLLAEDRRTDLETYVASTWYESGNVPTVVVDGTPYLRPRHLAERGIEVPAGCLRLGAEETGVQAVLTGVRWTGPTEFELTLDVWLAKLGFGDEAPVVALRLVDGSGEVRVPVPVELCSDVRVNRTSALKYHDNRLGSVRAEVDVVGLVAAVPARPVDLTVELDVAWSGVRRTGGLTRRARDGALGALGTPLLAPRQLDGARVELREAGPDVLGVRLAPAAAHVLTAVDVVGDEARLHVSSPGRVRGERLLVLEEDGAVAADVPLVEGDAVLTLLGTPAADPEDGRRRVMVHGADGKRRPVAWALPDDLVGTAAGVASLQANRAGWVALVDARHRARVVGVDFGPDTVAISIVWDGAPAEDFSLVVRRQDTVLDPVSVSSADGVVVSTFSLLRDPWGVAVTAVPSGQYAVGLVVDGVTGSLRPGTELLDAARPDTLVGGFRAGVRIEKGRVSLRLAPGLADDEIGAFAQEQARRSYASYDGPVDASSVYLQCYEGGGATDSQLAIFEELRRSHPDLTAHWAVADRSARVPEGAVPILINSREWYAALASAGHFVVNVDLPRWFRKRPGQRFLQTFHGYPAKAMGMSLWRTKKYTPLRIASELGRTARDWDAILTPAPEMDAHYRREYLYDGPILNQGYPRDDVLVSPEADRIRDEVRRRLGVRDGQTAVLHAPTWRDDAASSYSSARGVEHLDPAAVARELGPDFVVLVRGHRFHQPSATTAAGVIDVTTYPEINDLILASDVAVLDYSSLRFDFALTGRPMLFLVPDLDRYSSGVRGFLFDFRESAPGPLLHDAAGVIASLRHLDEVVREHAPDYARFQERFNAFQDGHAARRVVEGFFE